jgi:hypothetical protein
MHRPRLTGRRGIKSAEMSGHIEWLSVNRRGMAVEDIRDSLLEVSTDPQVLGDKLGVYRHRMEETGGFARIVEALEMTGADEQWAAAVLEWQRWRKVRDAHASGPVL